MECIPQLKAVLSSFFQFRISFYVALVLQFFSFLPQKSKNKYEKKMKEETQDNIWG